MVYPNRGGFHLVSFATPEFTLPLFDQKDFDSGPKASILIGPNGSNKSRVLSALVEELVNIEGLRREFVDKVIPDAEKIRQFKIQNHSLSLGRSLLEKSRKKTSHESDVPQARLEYWLADSYWSVERRDRDLTVWKDGKKVNSRSLLFPDRAIAVAHLPTDRFKFTRNEDDDFYVYLGLRQATNMTTTGALENKVLLGFVNAIGRTRALSIFKNWFEDLGLNSSLKVELGLNRRSLLEADDFQTFRDKALDYFERLAGPLRELSDERRDQARIQLEEFWPFFQALREFSVTRNRGRLRHGSVIFSINFDLEHFPSLFSEFDVAKMIDLGRRLRVISDAALVFLKSGQEFRFSELSSGEQQILGTVIRFVAHLGENSVLVIDEPEVSLHPAWQRIYLPRLLETLKQFPQTHAIIATHSHFIVSDVSEKQASVTVASNVPGSRFQSFDGDVYGRSPENILYRVFGIATTSNFYVERDLTKALRMISGVDELDLHRLRSIYERLQVVDEPDNEAMIEILDRIQTVLERSGG
ncbi:putative AbiEii toxin of type IV toxin-antitoxin system [Roseinatronobacter thiooxidans]|uniref:Putative AbiEii toxin of type IV toxin-antitoxin system n=1 Tax=Roseinatronobacter thiooxidans TaxID=121821 RepID=A0A2W7Q483_9RHOB|nr:AAA family ATPase [Roseinatronobacter thiooxidans]PZX38977.1 putative AbiEii toxin of type IV toxin-antitoxin system [Roseinatronobacter thiooxidans]